MRKIFMYKNEGAKGQVDTFIKASNIKIRKKFDFILRYIADERNQFKEPYVKHFSIEKYKRLYELRLKAAGTMVRIIFYNIDENVILLFECHTYYLDKLFQYEYPWEILPKIKEYIISLINEGLEGFEEISECVYVGKNVKIYPTATIEGPAIIGDGTEIRPGAFIRGSVITGANCVIGNSSELKNCVLLDKVQVPHYNYVGDSILGNHSHMGAGSICSNLKSDGKPVVIHGDEEYKTGLRKIGAILADGADVGCGCVLNPGTIIGKNTSVYPLNALRGVFPSGCIVKSQNDIVKRK